MNNRISIHITTKDRHSEVAILLQSLRTQTYQAFDIMLLDDGSGTPLTTHHPTMSLINRLKLENHKIKIIRNEISNGVCAARNKLIEEDKFNNEFTCRLDDDCIPEDSYLGKLMIVIHEGDYDMATGVIPLLAHPEIKRDSKHIGKTICLHKLNKKGELIERRDELAYGYLDTCNIFPCHQFRTNCLYKSEIHKKVRYPTTLSKVGFREEGFFSLKAIALGYKIGCDVNAIAYHLQTNSGGCRQPDYAECVALDDETFQKWLKKLYNTYGNFLEK